MLFRGNSGQHPGDGGGSGGSIWIIATKLFGSGRISIAGGNGYTRSGGGSAGLLSLQYSTKGGIQDYDLKGGQGVMNAGSGILHENVNGKRSITVDGYSKSNVEETVIACDSGSSIELSKLTVLNRGRLNMQACPAVSKRTLFIDALLGDPQSELSLQDGRQLYVAYRGDISYELPLSLRVLPGALLHVPNVFSLKPFTKLHIAGKLVGAASFTLHPYSQLLVKYPGFTSYRDISISRFSFEKLVVESRASVVPESQDRTHFDVGEFELQYSAVFPPIIPLILLKKSVKQSRGPSLSRLTCPHGHEIVNISSDIVYDPCGTGKLFHYPRNVSYQANVTHYRNVSYLVREDGWEIREGHNVSYTRNVTRYMIESYLVEVTRWKIVYNITCNYEEFTLLVGQRCSLPPGRYRYSSLVIQQQAVFAFHSNGYEETILEVGNIKVFTDGRLSVLPHSLPNRRLSSTDTGASHGGQGGKGASSMSVANDIYGSVVTPKAHGRSGGGGTTGDIGKGGGQLVLNVSRDITHDGVIDANGGDGIGGGSGGSLLIIASWIKGRGVFRAEGGAGQSSNGGGGGGGRIAIYTERDAFKGSYSVHGGSAFHNGQPGTVVLVNTAGIRKKRLLLNESGVVTLPANSVLYYFDEISIGRSTTFNAKNFSLITSHVSTQSGCFLDVGSNASIVVNSTKGLKLYCNINVRENAVFNCSGQLELSSSGSEQISGWLQAGSLVVQSLKSLSMLEKSYLITKSIYIGRKSNISLSKESRIGHSSSYQLDIERLTLSVSSEICFSSPKVTMNVISLSMARGSRLKSMSELDLTIKASKIMLENQSEIKALGNDKTSVKVSSGNKTCGFGGSHGGQGGGSLTGEPYGILVRPTAFGSSGGSVGSLSGSFGGGVLFITTKTLVLNGNVSVSGVPSFGSQGGGSGGSLLIEAEILSGQGSISANGGNSLCGGGGGGRISLNVKYRTNFKGRITAYGGKGAFAGAAGTIFISEKIVGVDVNSTFINNNGLMSNAESKIVVDSETLTLQNLDISGEGKLTFASSSDLVIKFSKVSGDFSGFLTIMPRQKVFLQTSKAFSKRPFMLPCSLSVKLNATLFLATRLFVTKTINKPSLYIEGRVIGGENIIAGKQGHIVVSRTGSIGILTGKPRTFSFRSIAILNEGKLKFESSLDEKVQVNSESIMIGYGGLLEGKHLRLKTPSLAISYGGRISVNGEGFPAGRGPGGGTSVVNWGAAGGAYGGFSGSGGNANGTRIVYGSLFKAENHGSGGGSSGGALGGSGGGILMVEAVNLLVDGTVSADGSPGAENAGGGSGGSIHIVTSKIIGLGSIQTLGGEGKGFGGSGSGGRISVIVSDQFTFKGIVDATGGKKANNSSIRGFIGSPGTAYIKDIQNNYFKREQLLIQNRLTLNHSLELLLNQTVSKYAFEIFVLKGGVVLHCDKNADIKSFESDDRSVLHVPDGVILSLEQTQASSDVHASFHVDKFGEVRLASKVTFLGRDNRLLGTLTGVFDFNIGETKTTTLSASGRTAQYKDGKYVVLSKRGEYKFIKVTLQNRAKLYFQNTAEQMIPISLASLEMFFGSVLSAHRLFVDSGEIILHTGAMINVSGMISNSSVTHSTDGGSHCGYGGGRIVDQYRELSSLHPDLTGEAGGGRSPGGLFINTYFIN